MSWKVYVDKSKCDGCSELHKKMIRYLTKNNTTGECVLVCPVEVFEMENGKSIPTGETWCIGCESCMDICPTNAIEITYD